MSSRNLLPRGNANAVASRSNATATGSPGVRARTGVVALAMREIQDAARDELRRAVRVHAAELRAHEGDRLRRGHGQLDPRVSEDLQLGVVGRRPLEDERSRLVLALVPRRAEGQIGSAPDRAGDADVSAHGQRVAVRRDGIRQLRGAASRQTRAATSAPPATCRSGHPGRGGAGSVRARRSAPSARGPPRCPRRRASAATTGSSRARDRSGGRAASSAGSCGSTVRTGAAGVRSDARAPGTPCCDTRRRARR